MIDVLLAVYKPNPDWLRQQRESILSQRDVEINLIEREDASGEGVRANFAALLAESRGEYVAFSDQDDIWADDKLAKMLAKMRKLESKYGKNAPLLVFCDSEAVDEQLCPLGETTFIRTDVDPRRLAPRQLVLQNVASGHAMLFNAALRDKALPIPPGAYMHDHWIGLVVSVFGHADYLNEPLVTYRQHKNNVIGAAKVNLWYFINRLRMGRKVLKDRLYANIRQAEAFVERYGDAAPECFKALVDLDKKAGLVRVWTLWRHRIFKHGILRNIGTWLLLVA